MYIVKYTKLAIMKDGTRGNISQGDETAYIDCEFEDIRTKLKAYLLRSERAKKNWPLINTVKKIKGHIVQ